MENLKKFLKEFIEYENEGEPIQAFTTRNIVGDAMSTVYEENGIQVDYCFNYSYIEIFGISDTEYKELEKLNLIYY